MLIKGGLKIEQSGHFPKLIQREAKGEIKWSLLHIKRAFLLEPEAVKTYLDADFRGSANPFSGRKNLKPKEVTHFELLSGLGPFSDSDVFQALKLLGNVVKRWKEGDEEVKEKVLKQVNS